MADEKDTLSDAEAANFGGQPEGEAPTGYIANFDGDEVDGKFYKMGERLADGVDAGTIAYLVQNGRFTPTTADAAGTPSGGMGGDTGVPNGDDPGHKSDTIEDDAFANLTDDQKAEAEKLKADNTAEQLRTMAADEGVEVETDDNKSDLAAKIVAARE